MRINYLKGSFHKNQKLIILRKTGVSMSGGLDIIIVDDDPSVGNLLATIIKKFYTWGEIIVFTDVDEAIQHCLNRDVGVAIFIVDVFLEDKTGFFFLDAIEKKFPTSHEDAIPPMKMPLLFQAMPVTTWSTCVSLQM
jgi:hypothetical protein